MIPIIPVMFRSFPTLFIGIDCLQSLLSLHNALYPSLDEGEARSRLNHLS